MCNKLQEVCYLYQNGTISCICNTSSFKGEITCSADVNGSLSQQQAEFLQLKYSLDVLGKLQPYLDGASESTNMFTGNVITLSIGNFLFMFSMDSFSQRVKDCM